MALSSVERAGTPDPYLLPLILLGAACLRFAGITHHLARGVPEFDERTNFVDPILRMWHLRTLDPTVNIGYAGFFNWLLFLPVVVGNALGGDVGAYGAARGVVAALSAASVFLVHRLGRRLLGSGPALFAAALLAVCPLEVRAAHYITADTLVGTASLAILLLLSRPEVGGREAVASGLWAGAATGLKYTGLLVGAPLFLGLLVRRRLRIGLPAAGAAFVLAFVLAAPYAVFQLRPEGAGFGTSVQAYYGTEADKNRFLTGGGDSRVLGAVNYGLGPVSCALAAGSLLLFRRRAEIVPAAGMVLGVIGVLLPANLIYPRHVVPAMGAAALLAAAGLAGLRERLPAALRTGAAALLVLTGIGPPLLSSLRLSERYRAVPAVEQAALWLEREAHGPSRVLTSLRGVRLDSDRFEVQLAPSVRGLPARLPAQYDYVLAANRGEADDLAAAGLEAAVTFPSEDGGPERTLTVFRPREATRRSSLPAPPAISVESHPPSPGLEAVTDGKSDTVWRGSEAPGSVEMRWRDAVEVERVEIEVGPDPGLWPQPFTLKGSLDGSSWIPLELVPLRPTRPARQVQTVPHGQVYLLLSPHPLVGLRIVRESGGQWGLAEVRLFALRVR